MKYYNWLNMHWDYRPFYVDNECVALDPNLHNQWLDENCDAQAYFICVRGTKFYIINTSVIPPSPDVP